MKKKSGLGSKKELNAELNLTPFIDLLSTCVCFLLITAVWIEIGTVEIKQSFGTQAKESSKISYDLDLVFKSENSMNLVLKKNGKSFKNINVKENNFDSLISKVNETIAKQLLFIGDKKIEIASATITPRTGVNYGNLISTLDTLRKNEIINIGVLTAKGR